MDYYKIDTRILPGTKLFGIIGNPLGHSISPQLHNTIYHYTKTNAVYLPFQVDKNHLKNTVEGLKAIGITGFNVTIPYKSEIMKFLDYCSGEAVMMGAVNTVKHVDGKLCGYNTDGEGFLRSLKNKTKSGFEGKVITVLGAGGAARALAVKAATEGAKKVYVVNRTVSKALEIAEIIKGNTDCIAQACGLNSPLMYNALEDSNIVINTTSLGMYPNINGSPVSEEFVFKGNQIVCDAIYNPPRTKFLSMAEKRGCTVINGLGMLIYQAIVGNEIWTGMKVPEKVTTKIFKALDKYLEDLHA